MRPAMILSTLVFLTTAAAQQWVSLDGPSHAGRGVAYDADRGRLVAFGIDGGTWEWDRVRWFQRATATAPQGRTGHAMVHDPLHHHVLLFGGVNGTATLSDTWAWNGVEWRQLTNGLAPAGRYDHAMTFDEGRGVVVMFGGPDNYVWEHDGSQWLQRSPPVSPPVSPAVAMVYDPVRAVTCLFPFTFGASQMWQWNGTTWSGPVSAPVASSYSLNFNVAFDRARQRLVACTPGIVSPVTTGFTREWDGVSWSGVLTPGTVRTWQALYFDPVRQQVVMYGGQENGTYWHSDQKAWDGSTWTNIDVEQGPFSREDPAIAHDPARGRTLLFGGGGASIAFFDTWEWNGQAWQSFQPAVHPLHRTRAATCFEPWSGKIALYGGIKFFPDQYLDDLWYWDGTNWSATAPAVRPQARNAAALAADTARNRLVLFGGNGSNVLNNIILGDTWEWDGTNWHATAPAVAPSGRFGSAMAFDPVRGRTVLFGGGAVVGSSVVWGNDTWSWDGSTWQQLAASVPSVLANPSAQLVPGTGRMLLVGRNTAASGGFETWDFDGTTFQQQTTTGAQSIGNPRLAYDLGRGRMQMLDGTLVLELSPTPAAAAAYGSGCGAPAPVLAARARPRTGAPTFGLESSVLPAQPVVFALAVGTGNVSLGNGCSWLTQPPLATMFVLADGLGMATQPIPLPLNQSLRGQVYFAQALVLAPPLPGGFAVSQGLRLQLGD